MTSTQTTPTTRHNLRQTDFLPTRFSGTQIDRDEVTAHFMTFTDYLDAQDINVDDTGNLTTILKLFKRTLQGQARLWIDGLTFNNFNDLRGSFVRRFSPAKSSYTHARDFMTMTMTTEESAEAFLQRLRQAAARIGYAEAQISHRLLDALPDECRATILMSASTTDLNTLTADDIAAKAQLFLELKTNPTKTKELTFSAQSEIDDIREQINSLKMTTMTDDNRHDRGRDQRRRPSTPRQTSTDRNASRDRHRDQSRDRYHNDRRGRSPYRHDDRQNRRQQSRPRLPARLICNYCQIPGHIWRDCRKRLRNMTQPPPPPPTHNYYGPAYNNDQPYYHQQQQQPRLSHQPRQSQQPQYQPRPQDF